jgi:hypothetical protein
VADGKDLEGSGHGLIGALSLHVLGGREGNHERFQDSRYARSRFEPTTSQIQVQIVIATYCSHLYDHWLRI